MHATGALADWNKAHPDKEARARRSGWSLEGLEGLDGLETRGGNQWLIGNSASQVKAGDLLLEAGASFASHPFVSRVSSQVDGDMRDGLRGTGQDLYEELLKARFKPHFAASLFLIYIYIERRRGDRGGGVGEGGNR